MFDLVENAGDNAGYELRIGYDTKSKRFFVIGYIVFIDNHELEYERDGRTLYFTSMEDALRYITEYQPVNDNQLVFDFERDVNAKHE
jgi:hypothetical protein